MSRKLQVAQNRFIAGEIDPLLAGRKDLEYYYTGMARARNVIVLPQGGVRRRPGLRYVDELRPTVDKITSGITATAPNGGTANNAKDDNLATLLTTTVNISTTNPYVIVHYDLGSAKTILYADVMGFSITTGSVDDEFVVQYSTDNTTWVDFAPSGYAAPASTTTATRRFSNNSPKSVAARYWRFVRIGSTNLGTAKANVGDFILWEDGGDLSDARIVDFTFSLEQAYLFIYSDENIAVYKDDVWQADIRSYLSEDKLNTLNWTQSLDTLLQVHEDVKPLKILRGGAHDQWQPEYVVFDQMPTYDFGGVSTTGTGTPAAVSGSTTFQSSDDYFTAGMVGQYIRGNSGFAEITGVTDARNVNITVHTAFPFDSTDPIAAGDWYVEEEAWSTTRGWPRSVTFHSGRLFFGGSKTLLQTLWGSKSGQYFNFGYGAGLDDEAIEIHLDTDQVSAIHQIYSGRHLSIFTEGSEFYIPDTTTGYLTPDAYAIRTSSRGIKEGLRVVEANGAIIFPQRGGKALREFLYDDVELAYSANNISLLSSHLIVDPVDLAMRRSTSTDEADLGLIVNSDGTLTILTTLREQKVTAFTLQITDGDFLRAGVADEEMYFIVERVVDGTTKRFIERFDEDLLLDCAITADRPTKDQYTATAGQTTFAFTTSIASTDELRVLRYGAVSQEWEQLFPTSGYTTSALPGTGTITLVDACDAGDLVVISYPTATFSGLDHLEGKTVRIVGDDKVKSTVEVSGGDAVVTDEAWETDAQAGLEFPDVTGNGLNEGVWVKDMPVEPKLQEGQTAGMKRRVVKVVVDLYETTHIVINGHMPDFEYLDETPSILDRAITPFTGKKTVRGLHGWDEEGQVDYTQVVPGTMTLLSATKRVAI